MKESDEKLLKKELSIDAHAVNIPSGAAELFIDRVIKDVKKSLKSKKIITDQDLKRAVHKELKKYNDNFAYVYKNRDKII